MSTAAQIAANQANAQHSTGPVTPEGKARVAKNATKLGLFSTSNFVQPEEQDLFADLTAGYMADLSPATPLEETLAREVVHAAWRLRRCADLECAPPEDTDPEHLERLQACIDRARSTAQRSLHRSLAELRRVQTERVYRQIALPGNLGSEDLGQASCKQIDPLRIIVRQSEAQSALAYEALAAAREQAAEVPRRNSAIQTQSQMPGAVSRTEGEPARPYPQQRAVVQKASGQPRNAPCPCGSREKYKTGMRVCRVSQQESVDGGIPHEEEHGRDRPGRQVQ